MSSQRALVRILVAVALCTALVALVMAPVPADLPAIALQQPGLYRLEVGLIVFYGSLLFVTPAFSGLVRGRLPVEISTRGAKFAEGADRWAGLDEEALKGLDERTADLSRRLADAFIEIERLQPNSGRDAKQQEVRSER